MNKDSRRIKFLGIEWTKNDLEVLGTVLEIGMEEVLHELECSEKIELAIENIKEIIA